MIRTNFERLRFNAHQFCAGSWLVWTLLIVGVSRVISRERSEVKFCSEFQKFLHPTSSFSSINVPDFCILNIFQKKIVSIYLPIIFLIVTWTCWTFSILYNILSNRSPVIKSHSFIHHNWIIHLDSRMQSQCRLECKMISRSVLFTILF